MYINRIVWSHVVTRSFLPDWTLDTFDIMMNFWATLSWGRNIGQVTWLVVDTILSFRCFDYGVLASERKCIQYQAFNEHLRPAKV